MPAGKLKDRVTLLQRQSGQDALGQPSTAWVDVASLWAEVRFVSGIETIKAGRETSTSRASVRIRNTNGIVRQMRVQLGGVDYEIVDIIPDPKRAYLTLICEVCQ